MTGQTPLRQPNAPRFDSYDLAVYEAHSLVEWEGAASFSAMRRVHDGPLTQQRVAGMIRRGLLYRDEDGGYCLPPHGVELAHGLRDKLSAEDRLTDEEYDRIDGHA